MATISDIDRVKIWNSFFFLARRDTQGVFEQHYKCKAVGKAFRPKGGMLPHDQLSVLGAITFCALAIEARTNHLIEGLVAERKLTRKEAEAASFLAPERKWFLLPRLAGRRRTLRADVNPHKAISEICSLRNAVAHVQFDRLSTDLPSPERMIELFSQLVVAMDDLNDVLGASRGVRKSVRKMGEFKCT